MSVNEGYVKMKDGVRLFFRKIGEGSQIVVIPNGMYLYEDFKRFAESRTLIFYDVRNRGLSDSTAEAAWPQNAIEQDVQDLDSVRTHFGVSQIDLIGHSYIGFTIAFYAMKYPAHISRLLQIGPTQPDVAKQYPAHLMWNDSVLNDVFSKLSQLREETQGMDPEEACKKFWSLLRLIYVANPENAAKVDFGRCELPNERNFMKYWTQSIFPSIQKIQFTPEQLKNTNIPVLIIHGTKDRSAPYVGARDWAMIWPQAQLVTVRDTAHVPWIESPSAVLNAIEDFLAGKWPPSAEKVISLS